MRKISPINGGTLIRSRATPCGALKYENKCKINSAALESFGFTIFSWQV